nr:reverse transcriptase domain-containing protein [Tanacetum cinerariifolium]
MIEKRNELFNTIQSLCEMKLQQEQAANLSINITEPSRRLNSFCYDDDDDYDYKESTIPLNEINSQIPPSNVIITSPPVLPTEDPKDSLIMGNEELNTIPKMESNEFINDVNPLFDEVLENIKSKDSYDSNLDESNLLVTPLFDANEDECFDSRGDVDKINDFDDGYYDSKGDILYLKSLLNDDLVHHDPSIPVMSITFILKGFIDEPPLEENAPTEGYGEAIVILEILAENFEIKMNLLQLVQANKFHGVERDNPHTHISNFKRMTATLKYRDIPNDAIKLMLFPYSLEGAARVWTPWMPLLVVIFLNKTTREALKIIENKSKVRYSRSKSNVSRVNTNSRDVVSKTDDRIDKLADQISNLVKIVNKQVISPTKAVKKTCITCGGAHAYYECIATDSNPSSVCAATGSYNQVSPPNRASHQISPPGETISGENFQNNQGYRAQMNNVPNFQNQGFQNQPFSNNQIPPSVPNEFLSYIKSNEIMIKSIQNQINVLRGDFNKQEENLRRNLNNDMRSILGSFFRNQPSTLGTLPSNIVPNPKGEMKAVTTRSGLAYEGPSIPTESPLEKVYEQNTEEILDKEHSNSSGSTAQVQPPVVPISIPKTDVLRTQMKSTIPYPSRLNDQKLREKATNKIEKFFQIFHDLHFDISFADALLLMPKFASTIKSLLANKNKFFELAKVLLNENCSAMLLKKLPEKLRDPGKFLIPYDFPAMEVCHALADLGESINLMPLSIWKKLSLPELTPTRMTLELEDRSITHPKGVIEDVFVKVGKFHFPTDFVVVDFEADLRVPLILGRSFLRTGHALIDVYGEEITLRVNDESITFILNQTMRYTLTYDDTLVNRVDVKDISCEEFVQDVLYF